MNALEKAVADLAGALETLEERLENQLDDQAAESESMVSARRQATVAYQQTTTASEDVRAAIKEIKQLLADDDEAVEENTNV